MPRLPLATASLLALSIALAGCGEDKKAEAPAQAAAAVVQNTAPAAASFDQAAARAVVGHYASLASAVFDDALVTAQALQQAIDALLAAPSDATLKAAREAWLAARIPYMQTEVFRFGNPVVDDWEGQLNAWPLDEGLIDYVAGDYQHALGNPGATANIIANTEIQVGEDKLDVSAITGELLASLNELGGSEANVATGYHAIEFLLWGQDLNGSQPGAGNRPASDYLVGEGATGGHNERRREYLKAATALLVSRPRIHGRPVAGRRRRQLPRSAGGRAGRERPAQDAVRHGQPVARRAGRRAHEGRPGGQLHRGRARLLQRQHPQLALLQRPGHPQRLPRRVQEGRRQPARAARACRPWWPRPTPPPTPR